MASISPAKAIAKFWSWFADVAPELAGDFENEKLLEELDTRLSSFRGVAWELGPGATAEHALTVSPDGDAQLLPLTQQIIAHAPSIESWEFHFARQPRSSYLEFSLCTRYEKESKSEIEIDARKWRYVLYQFPDGVFDLILEQSNLGGLGEEDRYTAAVVLIDSVLGEATRLARINQIEPVLKLTGEQARNATSIKDLAAQFQAFIDA
jgi:hypothetical protein